MSGRRLRHAFVVRDAAPVAPMGEAAARSWYLGGRLAEKMTAVLRGAGLTVELADDLAAAEAGAARVGGAIVTHDSLAFSPALLRKLLAAFAASDRPALVAALPAALASDKLAPLGGLERCTVDGRDGWRAPLYALAAGGRVADAVPALLPYKEVPWKVPVPVAMHGTRELAVGATDTFMARVDHWVSILRVNQLALMADWFERWQRPLGKLWFLWRLLCGFPWTRGRLTASLNRIHRTAFVHHTAHVELSVIEAGAYVGPGAIVKGSWLGQGAFVDDRATVGGSVVGPGATVSSSAQVMGAVLYPDAFAAQLKMQLCVFGEASIAFTGSYFYDTAFGKNVQVVHHGAVVDSGEKVLGVCLGPRARVAGHLWIAAGREVPAGALIVQPPDEVLYKIDESLAKARMVTVHDRRTVDVAPLPPPAV